MILDFIQGIVQAPSAFVTISGRYASLNSNVRSVIATAAHREKNYLITEAKSVPSAWGPLSSSDQWLYWDIHTLTAKRSFGITEVEPVVQLTAPLMPAIDTHWFNPSEKIMKVWTGSAWIERIRVFCCKVAANRTITSMSMHAPAFTGTQVGIENATFRFPSGEILFDLTTNRPAKAGAYFLTSEDDIGLSSHSSTAIRLESIVLSAESQSNVPAFTVVYFSDFGKITAANQTTLTRPVVVGMVKQPTVVGEIVHVTTVGTISNPDWDWSNTSPGTLLFVGPSGNLITTAMAAEQAPFGIVVDHHTIVIGNAQSQRISSAPPSVASHAASGSVQLNIPPAIPGKPVAIGANDPRLERVDTLTAAVNALSIKVAALEQSFGK